MGFSWVCSPVQVPAVAIPGGQRKTFHEWGLVEVGASWLGHLMPSSTHPLVCEKYTEDKSEERELARAVVETSNHHHHHHHHQRKYRHN
ncbi:hypothetical protein ACE6H2_022696 [Prunus campanulata]